jgi:hypothetical protein
MQAENAPGEKLKVRRSGQDEPCWLREGLNAHASGRKRGDQFCIYVADRILMPTLTRETIEGIAAGQIDFDGPDQISHPPQ